MRRTAVYRHDLFLAHQPGFNHVESPDRLVTIYNELDRLEPRDSLVYPDFSAATLETIGLNHSRELIRRIAETAGRQHDFLDADTQTSEKSFDAACMAAGAVVDGLQRIADREVDNAFCLVRPPGHHAEKERAMGFCLFNNVAVGAHWAMKNLGYERIFIFDWDLHHGNGTQHSFYNTDKVFYCSTHQYPYYPGTGALAETGSGKGDGFTLNIPLPGGQDDADFVQICSNLVVPVIRAYRPDIILVSCGFDIYGGDPLGTMRVSPAGFAWMTRLLLAVAEEVCEGRLLVTLEGGYNLSGMKDGAMAVLTELCGELLNQEDYSAGFEGEDSVCDREAPFFLEQPLSLAKSLGKM
ncbi:MAG: hypothetical protein Kow0089_11570 [Desulfobulbaceae bacterium]